MSGLAFCLQSDLTPHAPFPMVEGDFDNLPFNKGLNRFTLRGRQTDDGQWKRYCLVQSIEKLADHGCAS